MYSARVAALSVPYSGFWLEPRLSRCELVGPVMLDELDALILSTDSVLADSEIFDTEYVSV